MRMCFLVLALFIQGLLCAQADRYLGVKAAHGFFIPHRQSLPQLLTGHTNGLSISYASTVDGSRDWHHHFGPARKGLALLVMDMGNREELGRVHAVYPFVDLPIYAVKRNGLWMHMGVGLAYLDKIYDREQNFFNLAIGSHWNYNFVVGLGYYREFDNLRIGTSLAMTHASNAAIELPNLGVNMATANLSMEYRFQQLDEPFVREEMRAWPAERKSSLIVSAAIRDGDAFTQDKHEVLEARYRFSKRFSPKCSYLLGTDIIHHAATYKNPEVAEDFGFDSFQAGVNGGITLEFGLSRLYLQQGFYILQGFQEQGVFYHRFGGLWDFSERFSADLSLKTHFAKADYLALGLSYRLQNNGGD